MVDYLSGVVDAIQAVRDGDITLNDLLLFVYNVLFKIIFAFIKSIFGRSKDLFVSIGNDITGVFDLPSFTENWYFWIIGIFITIFIVKFIATTIIELISKFLDIT